MSLCYLSSSRRLVVSVCVSCGHRWCLLDWCLDLSWFTFSSIILLTQNTVPSLVFWPDHSDKVRASETTTAVVGNENFHRWVSTSFFCPVGRSVDPQYKTCTQTRFLTGGSFPASQRGYSNCPITWFPGWLRQGHVTQIQSDHLAPSSLFSCTDMGMGCRINLTTQVTTPHTTGLGALVATEVVTGRTAIRCANHVFHRECCWIRMTVVHRCQIWGVLLLATKDRQPLVGSAVSTGLTGLLERH